jgi:hypothetical protein
MKPGISSTVMQHVLRMKMKKRSRGEPKQASSSVPCKATKPGSSHHPQVDMGNIGFSSKEKTEAAFVDRK